MKYPNIRLLTTLLVGSGLASGYAQAALITKAPDQGPFYRPLSPAGGTYVYANSFVATANAPVIGLGTWLSVDVLDAATTVKFQVWGSVGNTASGGPDAANVLVSTADLGGFAGPLSFYAAPTTGSPTLSAGGTYWFVATVVGSPGLAQFQVGAHTQNTGGIIDNGTFWFSNDPAGQIFDGSLLLPEMAFQVEVDDVVILPDMDGDGVPDVSDNCPTTPNPNQADADQDGVGDVCDQCPADAANDADGDGLCGDVDACPTSDLRPTVVIGSCDSGVPNTLFSNGCTIADLIAQCAATATSQDDFEDCVDDLTKSLKDRGFLTGKQRSAIRKCASRSGIGGGPNEQPACGKSGDRGSYGRWNRDRD